MNGVTAPELCSITGIGFARFETKRRRLRGHLTLNGAASVAGAEYEPLPVKDVVGGKWARYDFEDALLLACTLRLEAFGLDFASAARLVLNAGTKSFFDAPAAPDFWIARFAFGDAWKHACGTLSEVLVVGAQASAVAACNVSEVAELVSAKALGLGLGISDREFTRQIANA